MSEGLIPEVEPSIQSPKKSRFRKALITLTGGLLLAISLGAVAVIFLVGRGPQPEEVLPSDTVAIAKIDLNPKINQRINLVRFLAKFPRAIENFDQEDPIGSLIRQFGLTSEIDWNAIKPWLGNRYAIAGIESAGSINAVVLLSVNDEAQAEYFMAKNYPDLKYEIMKGFLVIAESKAVLNLISSSPKKLSESMEFKQDIDSLGEDHIALIWADLKPISRLGRDELYNIFSEQGIDSGLYDPSAIKGRLALGMRFTPDTFETNFAAFGVDSEADKKTTVGRASEAIGQLPSSTLGALAIEGIADVLENNVLTNQVVKESLDSIDITSREVRDFFAGPVVFFALNGQTNSSSPEYFLRLTPENVNVTVASLRRLFRSNGLDPQELDSLLAIEGENLYIGASQEALAQALEDIRSRNASLSELEEFKKSVNDNSIFAAFVNLEKLIPKLEIDTKGAPLSSLGISIGISSEKDRAVRGSLILSLKN
jgi:hypothetical protein